MDHKYYPLTKEQRQIYDLVCVEGDAPAMITAILEYPGGLEAAALKDAVAWLIDSNEVLHARIIQEGAEPKQVFDVPTESLFAIMTFQNEIEAEAYAKQLQEEGLSVEGSLCFVVGYTKENSCGLIIHMHHILGDGWTVMLLGRQFAARLQKERGIADNQPVVYPYSEYILHAQQEQQQKKYQRDLAFWRSAYEEIDNPYLLAPNRAYQAADARRMSCPLRREDAERIQKLCEACNTTPAAVFFTLFAAYFDRVRPEKEEAFLIGVPFYNRRGERERNTAGIFVNTFAVRAGIEAEKSFRYNLNKLDNTLFNSMRHLNCSYNAVLQDMNQKGKGSRRLYDVSFNYMIQNTGAYEARVRWLFCGKQAEALVINISDFQTTGGFEISYDYRRDVFREEEIASLHSRLITMLSSLSNQVDLPISEAAFLTEEERELVLHRFNDTAADYPRDKTVIDLFEEQAQKTPDNVAVVFEDTRLTFAELNAKANQLARKLRDMGVKPDDFVAMLTERSLEMIIGIYGILKAGGAYVPMDPTYPEERIRYMLEDCKPKVVLTYHATIETNIPIIDLADSEVWTGMPENIEHVNKPSDLAYCIYTSGTTGKPKGVLVEHRSVVNFVGCNDKTGSRRTLSAGAAVFSPPTISALISRCRTSTCRCAAASRSSFPGIPMRRKESMIMRILA